MGIITDCDTVIRAVADGQDVNMPESRYATKDVFILP